MAAWIFVSTLSVVLARPSSGGVRRFLGPLVVLTRASSGGRVDGLLL